jgi:hypothetical protein
MKKIICWFLLGSIMLNVSGCYTFSEIETPPNNNLPDSLINMHDIKIYFKSGVESFSEENFHITYTDSADYILGMGQKYPVGTNKSEQFAGQIFKTEINSIKTEHNFHKLYLNNGYLIVMEKNNFKE